MKKNYPHSSTQALPLGAILGMALLTPHFSVAANQNVLLGKGAGKDLTTGKSNTALGFQALFKSKGGDFNVAVGDGALFNTLGGNNNVAIGVDAGAAVVSGNDNIYIDNAGRANETGTIRIGTKGIHTNTFLNGVVHGDGSKLEKVKVSATNIKGVLSPARIGPASLDATKLAPNLTLGGNTTGNFIGNLNGDVTGNLNGNAATATIATNAVNADTAKLVADTDYKLSVTNVATLGQDSTGFEFDTTAGLLLESQLTGGVNDQEGSGLFLGTNKAVIYSSGDDDILKVFDEDEMDNISPVPAFRVQDGTLGVTAAGAVNAGTSLTSAVGTAPGAPIRTAMLAGRIASGGVTIGGTGGFTSATGGIGICTITFNTPFTAIPVVTATTFGSNAEFATVSSASATSCTIRTFSQSGAAVNSDFQFHIIGAR